MRRSKPKAPMKDVVGQLTIGGTVEEEIGGYERPTASRGKSVKNMIQEGPLTERPGRCGHCGHAFFQLKADKGHMFRKCQKCEETINVMTMEIITQGIPGKKWGG